MMPPVSVFPQMLYQMFLRILSQSHTCQSAHQSKNEILHSCWGFSLKRLLEEKEREVMNE
jgi:hypothetical protein